MSLLQGNNYKNNILHITEMECLNLFSNGIRPEDSGVSREPPDIFGSEQIFDVKFSPTANVIAYWLVTGEVKVNIFTEEYNNEAMSFFYHQEWWRVVEFSDDGNYLYTGSSDNTIGIISNGELLHQVKKAHDSPINCIKYMDRNSIIATGDEEGTVKIWDFRISSTKSQQLWIATFKENEDAITDLKLNSSNEMLLASSNDGFLSVFDIKKLSDYNSDSGVTSNSSSAAVSRFNPTLYARSDNQQDELTGLWICKNQRKVVVSTQEGVLLLFSWDWFGDCDDRSTCHPSSIACMSKLDEDTLITGCDDGYIRAVSILPNKVVSIINSDIDPEDCLPISRITIKDNMLAYVAYDEMIRIYDISELRNRHVEAYDSEDEANIAQREENMKKRKLFNEDMEDEDDGDKEWDEIEDELEEDSEDEEEKDEKDEEEEIQTSKKLHLYFMRNLNSSN